MGLFEFITANPLWSFGALFLVCCTIETAVIHFAHRRK